MASGSTAGPSGGQGQGSGPPPTPSSTGPATAQNLNSIVIEYLNKKGYSRTEAMLRVESAHVGEDGRPIVASLDDDVRRVSEKAYILFKSWIEGALDLWKPELRRMLYPVFVHIFLHLVAKGYPDAAREFFVRFSPDHELLHSDELKALKEISEPQHLTLSDTAKMYLENKYRVRLTTGSNSVLTGFMSDNDHPTRKMIVQILNDHLDIIKVANQPMLTLIRDESVLGDDEGIPGHASENIRATSAHLPSIKLGHLPMDKDMIMDVEEELAAEDARLKEASGEGELGVSTGSITLLENFQQNIKREETDDSPMRDTVPLPPYKGFDIKQAVKATKEHKQRFRFTHLSAAAAATPGLEGAVPGSSGPLPSCVMYTFHNTCEALNNITFSNDFTLCAGGFSQSYVRIWSLNGEKLTSLNPSENENVTSSRKLIGHSGPVYGLSISPDKRCLLSSSEDGSVRMWSLDTYTALVAYRGHNNPVWDVAWGPFGHYFITGSRDKTARLWSSDHISPLRIFAGHSSDVDVVGWHPNNNYAFTASNDRTLRMWDISTGNSVRLFNGHTSAINCLQVSPDGKMLASGGNDGLILIWDIASGRKIKSLRGHAKQQAVWSVSWSVEGEILVSGGSDNTVRVWNLTNGGSGAGQPGGVGTEMVINGIGGIGPNDGTGKDGASGGASGSVGGTKGKGKKDKRDVVASPEHMTAYYTKKSPVLKVAFTNKNCVIAGGSFLP